LRVTNKTLQAPVAVSLFQDDLVSNAENFQV
jgi:hypothetical protein